MKIVLCVTYNQIIDRVNSIAIAISFVARMFLCALSLVSFASPASSLALVVAYEDKEQPPYYMGNSLLVPKVKPGVTVEMVKLLEEHITDLKVEFVRCPWKRCLHDLRSNRIDGVFNASYKKSRLEIGWYPTLNNELDGAVDVSKRTTQISYSIYVIKNSGVIWDGNRIKNVRKRVVGAPAGYSIVGDLRKKGMIVDESPSTQSNLERLILERVDAVALQDVTADSLIRGNPNTFSSIQKLSPPFATKAYYLMLSHEFVGNNPTIAHKIWTAMEKIRDKNFQQLVTKYH